MNRREFPLSLESKKAILKAFFPCAAFTKDIQNNPRFGETYFQYYQKTVESCRAHTTTVSHEKITELVTLLKTPGTTRKSAELKIRKQLPEEEFEDSDDIVEDSINLAAQLLLMMPTGVLHTLGRSVAISGETRLNWTSGGMSDLINTEFYPQLVLKESVKLEKIFNARNLERIAGIKIIWTSNLADHLRLRDDDKAVEIFHHASFLHFHQNDSIFAPGLITEALNTLALLLPSHDPSLKSWFLSISSTHLLDPLARECGSLKTSERQITNFSIWHDRLVILKQAFDEAEPSSIKNWWCDRRKRVQWYTFWVAAVVLGLTILFGLVQSVEGGIQVYYAAKGAAG